MLRLRMNALLVSFLVLTCACHSSVSSKKEASVPSEARDTSRMLDTPRANRDALKDEQQENKRLNIKTHLKDTSHVAGNFILFLRPDDARFDELDTLSDGEVNEADGDFGVGIAATEDSMPKNQKYKDIQLLVSTKRYIAIADCLHGPIVIDRDTVNYGYILSGKRKHIVTNYEGVHSGHYFGAIDDFFFPEGH